MSLSRPKRWLTLALIGGAVALLSAVVAVGSSPRVCALCHSALVDASAPEKHASLACYECHAPGAAVVAFKAAELTRMYPAALLGGRPEGSVRPISSDSCIGCHAETYTRKSDGALTGILINHNECAPSGSCGSCHSDTAHGSAIRWQRSAVMEDCVVCHKSGGAPLACDTCHEGRLKEKRLETGPWQVTHGPKWESTHGMGKLDLCTTCHPDDYCIRCHKIPIPHDIKFGAEHGRLALGDEGNCKTCHKSTNFCAECHGVDMPHAAGYLKQHPESAGTLENPACVRCHAVEDCEKCHERHIHPGNAKNAAGLLAPSGDAR